MSKELEALENIKIEAGIPYFSSLYDIDMWKEDFATIETALKALEIMKSKITNISFKYGGIMGNVIKLQFGCDTCYLHFDENDKNFDLLKEVLHA